MIQESIQSGDVVQEHAMMMAEKPKGTDWISCWFLFFSLLFGQEGGKFGRGFGAVFSRFEDFGTHGLFVKKTA